MNTQVKMKILKMTELQEMIKELSQELVVLMEL